MRITIDENGYVNGWNIVGDDEGIECEAPEDFDRFSELYNGYKYLDSKLIEDPERIDLLIKDRNKQELRRQREELCFPFINRGELWYRSLDQNKLDELKIWYKKWLDVTETLQIPDKPEWLV